MTTEQSAPDIGNNQKDSPYQEEQTSLATEAAPCFGNRGLCSSSETSAGLLSCSRGEPEVCLLFLEEPGDALASWSLPLPLFGLFRRRRIRSSGDPD